MLFSFAYQNKHRMKKQLLAKLENSKNYTLAVANGMPSAHYDFKPTEEVWSFRELMHHIGYGIYWFKATLIEKEEPAWEPPAVTADKNTTIAWLETAFAALENTLKKMASDGEAVIGFFGTLDHITHHRGQATTYLRCKGITPPEYIF